MLQNYEHKAIVQKPSTVLVVCRKDRAYVPADSDEQQIAADCRDKWGAGRLLKRGDCYRWSQDAAVSIGKESGDGGPA